MASTAPAKSKKNLKRTRLSPEARRDQILDEAKKAISKDGVQQFSLKKLAVQAGVSEPLLFHYFSSRIELLQQLLQRDYTQSINSLKQSLDGAESIDEILRIYITRNYDQFDQEKVINLLLAESEIVNAVQGQRQENIRHNERFLVEKISGSLGIPRKKAAMIALMASEASLAGARFAHETNIGREQAIETVMEFVKAGFESQNANN